MPITVNYTLPAGPTVVSINLASPNPTTPAASVSWTVTFSQSVTGVTASAFALAASGVSGATITSVTGSGTTWTVTANTGSGYGTLGLNQIGPGSVVPTLSGTFTGQVYTVYPPLTCITDNFNAPNNSPPDPANWSVGVVSGSFTPVILGNRLRITDTGGSEATRVTNKNLFPFGNNLVIAEFDYWAYGGSGADGHHIFRPRHAHVRRQRSADHRRLRRFAGLCQSRHRRHVQYPRLLRRLDRRGHRRLRQLFESYGVPQRRPRVAAQRSSDPRFRQRCHIAQCQ
jgi:hypothetical protein